MLFFAAADKLFLLAVVVSRGLSAEKFAALCRRLGVPVQDGESVTVAHIRLEESGNQIVLLPPSSSLPARLDFPEGGGVSSCPHMSPPTSVQGPITKVLSVFSNTVQSSSTFPTRCTSVMSQRAEVKLPEVLFSSLFELV